MYEDRTGLVDLVGIVSRTLGAFGVVGIRFASFVAVTNYEAQCVMRQLPESDVFNLGSTVAHGKSL